MNLWNFIYLALSVVVLSTLPRAAYPLLVACLLPVLLLWAGRWIADRARSRARTQAMAGSHYTLVQDRRAVARTLRGLGPALRDRLMRGYPTGLTQYWVRDAWSARRGSLDFIAMELQTTPGYMGTGIPVWRVRHGALLVTGARAAALQPALLAALDLDPGSQLFTLAGEAALVIVWPKQAPDGARLRWLLDRTARMAPGEPIQ